MAVSLATAISESPLGCQTRSSILAHSEPNCLDSPPSTGISMKTLFGFGSCESSPATVAIILPSGDHAGTPPNHCTPDRDAIFLSFVPSALATNTDNSFVAISNRPKLTCRPSGENWTTFALVKIRVGVPPSVGTRYIDGDSPDPLRAPKYKKLPSGEKTSPLPANSITSPDLRI